MANEKADGVDVGVGGAESSAQPASVVIEAPRKRGRPKGSGKGSARPAQENNASTVGDSRASSVDPSYIVSTVIMLFELGDDYFRSRLLDRLKKYVPEKAGEFREMMDKQAFGEKDREMLRHTLNALVAKYDILSKIGPEIGLLVFLGQYGFRMYSLAVMVESFKPVNVGKTDGPSAQS